MDFLLILGLRQPLERSRNLMDMINCMISDNYYVLGCFVKDREVEINKQFLDLPSSVHSDSNE